MSKKRAFTLVELLVVISIIALLLAMLLPALSRARQQAQSTVCKSRVKQIAMALQLYAQSNSELYVTSDWILNGGSTADPKGHWFTRLGQYIGAVKGQEEKLGTFMRCPSGKAIKEFGNTINYSYVATDYGLQRYPGPRIPNTPRGDTIYCAAQLSAVKQPAEFVAIFDFYFGELALKNTTGYDAQGKIGVEGSTYYGYWYKAVEDHSSAEIIRGKIFRHNKSINVAYADSHVGNIKVSKLEDVAGDSWWWDNICTPSSDGWFTNGPGKRL